MSKLEELQTTVANLEEKVDDTLLALEDVKRAIISDGIEVADGTPVSEYAGKIEGLYESGKQAEYDAMWDAIQNNGNRVNYNRAFSNGNWTKEAFNPKYSIIPTEAEMTFYYFGNSSNPVSVQPDFRECFDAKGLILDFSNVQRFSNTFQFCYAKGIGVIDMSNATYSYNTFYNFRAETIEKLILPKQTSIINGNEFQWCSALKNIEVEGILDCYTNNMYLGSSPLSKNSIISFITALSTSASGKSITFKTDAVKSAFETSTGLKDGDTSQEWLDLIATKPNWTISLGG